MSNKYFKNPRSGPLHPRIRLWQDYLQQAGGRVRLAVSREREDLGYGPLMVQLDFLNADNRVQHHDETPWKMDLDDWLVEHGHRADRPHEEALRFSFRLRGRCEPLWQQWGDGYFNSVLIVTIEGGPFSKDLRIANLVSAIHAYKPYDGGNLSTRVEEVEGVFYSLASELITMLKYSATDGEAILGGALATYLDDRFHVNERLRLFGATGLANGPTPKKIAALALAHVLEQLLRAETGKMPSSYFFSAVGNIERGDDTSVDVNWPIIDREIGGALPEGYVPAEIKNAIRLGLGKKLIAHDPEVIDEACDLLALTPGGDAEAYRRTWGRTP